MKGRMWVLVIVLSSWSPLACGSSSKDGDGGGESDGGTAGSATGGSPATGGSSGGSTPSGGSGGSTSHPLCDAYAEEFVSECPQNGTLGDARWLCEEGFAEYSALGCESEWNDLVVCAMQGSYDCVTGSVTGCDALLDALMLCAE